MAGRDKLPVRDRSRETQITDPEKRPPTDIACRVTQIQEAMVPTIQSQLEPVIEGRLGSVFMGFRQQTIQLGATLPMAEQRKVGQGIDST